jgi:caffeoyl-CoA O-methyltransferase
MYNRRMPDLVHPAVRDYLASLNAPRHPIMVAVRERSIADQVPAVSLESASFLHVLASALPARHALEIGTGYAVSGLAVVLGGGPDSRLITIERDAARAAVAREHFSQAGLADRATVIVGEAVRYVHKVAGPFDLILQDGDKEGYESLLDKLLALLRPGGVLVSDNILWRGDVVPGFAQAPVHSAASIEAISRYNTRLASDPRLRTAFLPVGDGLAVAVKMEGVA